MNRLDYRSPAHAPPPEPTSPPAWVVPVVLAAVPVAVVVEEVLRRWPVNHWGFDVRWFLPIPALSAAWAAAGCRTMTRRQCATVLASAALSATVLLAVDRWNALVEYDTWTGRRMPDAFGRR